MESEDFFFVTNNEKTFYEQENHNHIPWRFADCA